MRLWQATMGPLQKYVNSAIAMWWQPGVLDTGTWPPFWVPAGAHACSIQDAAWPTPAPTAVKRGER